MLFFDLIGLPIQREVPGMNPTNILEAQDNNHGTAIVLVKPSCETKYEHMVERLSLENFKSCLEVNRHRAEYIDMAADELPVKKAIEPMLKSNRKVLRVTIFDATKCRGSIVKKRLRILGCPFCRSRGLRF